MPTIDPKNLSAQLAHRARGNPPSSQPYSAVSNCFPGLEFDFRNIWKHLFEGIELHEGGAGNHVVLDVVPGSPAAAAGVAVFDSLVEVDGRAPILRQVLPSGPSDDDSAEFANALAHIFTKAGTAVLCVFEKESGARVTATLTIRPIFEGVALAEPLAEPGALTQSLCSPWQADYRECACFYWAASRPDFVNYQPGDGPAKGHDWMQTNRGAEAPYQPDGGGFSPAHVKYDDLYKEWEKHLRFIVGGKDEA